MVASAIIRRRRGSTSLLSLYAVLGFKPQLVLDFDDEKYFTRSTRSTFSDAMTHTRAGNATMVDSDGVLKWAPHNLLLRSEEFDNASWSKAAGVTVTANTDVAPDGTTTADTVTSGGNQVTQGVTCLQNTVYTDSIFIKKTVGATYQPGMYLLFSGGTLVVYAVRLDTDAGVATAVSAAGYTAPSSFSVADAGSYWRLSISGNSNNNTTADLHLYPNLNAGGGVGPGSQVVWGAQLYRSDLGGMTDVPSDARAFPSASTYVPTTSAARYLPRRGHHIYNGSAWVNEGVLVESEARTNLVTYSNDFTQWIAVNGGVALAQNAAGPDGLTSAWTITDSDVASRRGIDFTLTNAATGPFSARVFVAKDDNEARFPLFNLYTSGGGSTHTVRLNTKTGATFATAETNSFGLSVTDSGAFWRLSWSITALGGANKTIRIFPADSTTIDGAQSDAVTGAIVIYGAQLEAGSTPSSYIPNAGAPSGVIRAADVLTIPAANLPWPTPNVIGEELVTNGTFDSDTSGWNNFNTGSLTVSGGQATLTTSATFDGFYQTIPTVTSKLLEISLDVVSAGSGVFSVGLKTSSNGSGSAFATTTFTSADAGSTVSFVAYTTSALNSFSVQITNGAVSSATIDNISIREIDPLSVSIQMDGKMTYADNNTGGSISGKSGEVIFVEWWKDANNFIELLNTTNTGTGKFGTNRVAAGVFDNVVSGELFSPGINVPYNIASRHGSTFINGAVDGTALTANTTPTALPDLSATDLQLGFDYMGTVKLLRMWAQDIGDAGLVEATEPSLVPSLSLTFDGTESSFIVEDWS